MRPRHDRRIRIRRFTRTDEEALVTVFEGLSTASRRARYMTPVEDLSSATRTALLEVDGHAHVALLAEARSGRRWEPVGIARYAVDGHHQAELAYEVVDAWHGRGVGSRLLTQLVDQARAAGVERLHATVLPDNVASLSLLRRVLPQLRVRHADGLVEVDAWLTEPPLELADVLADLQVA